MNVNTNIAPFPVLLGFASGIFYCLTVYELLNGKFIGTFIDALAALVFMVAGLMLSHKKQSKKGR